MIIVRLSGGLGNQMFQYALGRHLAEKHSAILKLDISLFELHKMRQYALHCFHIWNHIATQNEIDSLRSSKLHQLNDLAHRAYRKIARKQPAGPRLPSRLVLRERDLAFDPAVLQKRAPLYLEGYWQSEKYFSEIAEIIRREFEVKYKQDSESRRIAEQIGSVDSISLHVRRTDYVQDARINQIHGTCDQSYYQRALQRVTERVKNPHFFIFSDDPSWVKAEMKLGFPTTIVEHNGNLRNFEDLRLMSLCKHNIIANSSFSWWGAWLNENPEKIIVAPLRWFADEARNSQAREIVPDRWTKL